jgi:secondary thiamine-phosphate synthase enzyme
MAMERPVPIDRARPRPVPEERPPALSAAATTVRLATRAPLEFVDLTARVESFVAAAGLGTGWVCVQSRHTTAAVLVNEHEPLLLEDLARFLERLAPRQAAWAHDALHRRPDVSPDERPNGHAHAKASILRSSETVNVVGGALQLGHWQRVLLVELDGPRLREVSLVALGSRGAR